MLSFEDQQRFNHPAAHVLAHYCNPDFLLGKHRALGHQDVVLLEHRVRNEAIRLRLSFMHSLDDSLPEFARRFMKKRTQVVQTFEWNMADRSGRILIDAKGAPMRIEGQTRLADCAGGCMASVLWELHCPVPLLGSRLEALLQDTMQRMTREDQAVTERLLSDTSRASTRAA